MDREVLKFYAQRRRSESDTARAIAELMRTWAIRIEVGRMRHKRRTVADDFLGEHLPVERALLTATCLDSPARDELVRRMGELGFTYVRNDGRRFRDWLPLKAGEGLVPLGFYVPRRFDPRHTEAATMQISLLMKFLEFRSDLVLAVIAGRSGWHVLTFHRSGDDAERLRRLFEANAPDIEFC